MTEGIDTSDANATSSDILEGKTAYVDGSKITGGMINRGSLNIIPDIHSQEIEAGYISGRNS